MRRPKPEYDVELNVFDPCSTAIGKGLEILKPLLSYTEMSFVQTSDGLKPNPKYQTIIEGDTFIPTGLIPMIESHCAKSEISINVLGLEHKLDLMFPVKLPESLSSMRDDQIEAINAALEHQRGVLLYPTGTGKTWVLFGILHALSEKKYKTVVLSRNASVCSQTVKELQNKGFKVTTDEKEIYASVLVTTCQSFCKAFEYSNDEKLSIWHKTADAIIVDECHVGMKDNGQYHKIMERMIAPFRIGLTATWPNKDNKHARLMLEGLLGPVIAEMTSQEAEKKELIFKPILQEVVCDNYPVGRVETYLEAVKLHVVNNHNRNVMIAEKTRELIKEGRTVLVFSKSVEHIKQIEEIFHELEIPYETAIGSVSKMKREKIRNLMSKGEIKCVITSDVFREGVNIPNVDALFLAFDGKSESSTIQKIGRALRMKEGKQTPLIIDIVDTVPYLCDHYTKRRMLYIKKGWT